MKVAGLTVVSGDLDRLPPDVVDGAFMLAGSVLPTEDQVRITARVTEGETGKTVWSDMYDRNLSDVLRLQAEVARRIAVEIEVSLTPREQALLSEAPRVDPDAFGLFLRGRNQWSKRTPQGLSQSVEYYGQALEIDSSSALIRAGMADAYALFPLYGVDSVSAAEAYALAEEYARGALIRDSTLGEARTALAHVLFLAKRDWPGAESEFEHAMALSPGYATLHQWYGEFLRARGLVRESLDHLHRANQLAPLDPVVSVALASGLWVSGEYEAAVAQSQLVLDELYPGYIDAYLVQALAHLALGRFDDMAAAAQAAGIPSELAAAVADALTGRGTPEAAVEAIASYESVLSPFQAGAFYAAVGAHDSALDALDRAEAAGNVNLLIYLRSAPVFSGLQGEPRYAELLRKLDAPSGAP
jgi:tetratricopeptide (TPR) repeat protein